MDGLDRPYLLITAAVFSVGRQSREASHLFHLLTEVVHFIHCSEGNLIGLDQEKERERAWNLLNRVMNTLQMFSSWIEKPIIDIFVKDLP